MRKKFCLKTAFNLTENSMNYEHKIATYSSSITYSVARHYLKVCFVFFPMGAIKGAKYRQYCFVSYPRIKFLLENYI